MQQVDSMRPVKNPSCSPSCPYILPGSIYSQPPVSENDHNSQPDRGRIFEMRLVAYLDPKSNLTYVDILVCSYNISHCSILEA